MLNPVKGNMYNWCDFTWNAIKGKCPHDCNYCYMKKYWDKLGEPRLDEKCFNDDLDKGKFIFVGSSIDMFADKIPSEWIIQVLDYCADFDAKFLFQTKNPSRFAEFMFHIPKNSILGITLETNKDTSLISRAPIPLVRFLRFSEVAGFEKMVSIEPIMDFDVVELVSMIKIIKPKFVSIGADSKNSGLPEPSKEDIEILLIELEKFTEVRIKKNLERLRK